MKRQRAIELGRKKSFSMCEKKRKFKSNEASFYASKFNQRKYECPICGHWHLTKHNGDEVGE